MTEIQEATSPTRALQMERISEAELPPVRPRKSDGGARRGDILRAQPVVKEVDFTELQDGSLVELVEDSAHPTRTLLAVWQDGLVSFTDRLEHGGQVLVPLQRQGEILRHIRLPRGTIPYKSVREVWQGVRFVISRCVVLDEAYVDVLASFVLSTWLVDRFPVAPYISVVGLPQSGKTTLLKVLSLVCRRPLLTADISSAAFYDACARFMPTLLIDETGTHGSNRYLRHLLRMGTTPDVVAMRKNRTFHAYGAKVICFLEPPNDPALNSRCILIPMTEASRPNLAKPTDPELQQLGDELQQRLLQFRFDRYKSVCPATIPGAERLRPRARDLLSCLAAPCVDDPDVCDFLLKFFEYQSATTQEPLSPEQNAVLMALFSAAHHFCESGPLAVARFTGMVNDLLEKAGERFRLQPRKVGSVLTSLGFVRRRRTNEGWKVYLNKSDQERIHQLAKTYGIDHLSSWVLLIPPEKCEMCQAKRDSQQGQDRPKKQE